MSLRSPSPETSPEKQSSLLPLWAGGIGLLAMTLCLAWLAESFPYETSPDRPIPKVVWLSWLASLIALASLFFALRIQSRSKQLVGLVLLFAIAFRLILVFSNPILEVDFYRYLWDGIAANQSVSPYKFSPQAVLAGTSNDPDLQVLQNHIAKHPSAKTIVSRVHFEQYTTLYPPVSQVVFRTATILIPDDASVYWHIALLKLILVMFDVGVIGVLIWVLAKLKKHPAWVMAYAWNPLVLKEIANGGHLDSIAIFFMTAGIGVFLSIAKQIETARQSESNNGQSETTTVPILATVASGGLMALGVGGKLFPVVFMPAMMVYLWSRGERKQSIVFALVGVAFSALVMWPMLAATNQSQTVTFANVEAVQPPDPNKPHDGLTVFMTNWRMNDAIFSGIYQNVEYDWREHGPPWYVFVPNETRIKWSTDMAELKYANGNPAYFIARLATVGMFAIFYLWVLCRIWKTESAEDFANLLFLTMGIFFYLQPTQNPWYWLWAMPLVCFAKNRGWLFVSLILFVYYFRFWYSETKEEYQFLGTTYVGQEYFDHCLVWLEFAIVVAILIAAPVVQRFRKRSQ